MPEKDYFRCSQFFLGLESPGNFQWEGYWSPLLHRCAGNHSWAPCWNWKERTLMSFCNSCVSLSFPTIKSLRAHSDCICLCILTCKKQDDPKAKCNNNQNGNKYNRHISLLINAYLKEKKERKTGREEGRGRKEREAERDRRRLQNEWQQAI